MPFHKHHICVVSHQCELIYVPSDGKIDWMPFHKCYICIAFHLFEFHYVFYVEMDDDSISHKYHIYIVSLCQPLYVLLECESEWIPFHIYHIYMAFHEQIYCSQAHKYHYTWLITHVCFNTCQAIISIAWNNTRCNTSSPAFHIAISLGLLSSAVILLVESWQKKLQTLIKSRNWNIKTRMTCLH